MQSTTSEETSKAAVEAPDTGSQAPRQTIEELKQRLELLNERVKDFIKERPAACLAGALALGYVVARIARRRS
jgi:hypothetical protein